MQKLLSASDDRSHILVECYRWIMINDIAIELFNQKKKLFQIISSSTN